jgi:hypothetical protein
VVSEFYIADTDEFPAEKVANAHFKKLELKPRE